MGAKGRMKIGKCPRQHEGNAVQNLRSSFGKDCQDVNRTLNSVLLLAITAWLHPCHFAASLRKQLDPTLQRIGQQTKCSCGAEAVIVSYSRSEW